MSVEHIQTGFNTLSARIERADRSVVEASVLIIAFLAIIPAWLNYDIISRDGAHLYIPVAKLFLQGNFHEAIFGPYRPLFLPLYELSIFLVAKITSLDLETSGRIVSAASFIIGALGIYKLTDVLFKTRLISLLSVLVYLSNRELLQCSVDCLKETLLVCLIIWGNYFIVKGLDSPHRIKNIIIGCLFFGAGGLVRSTAFIFLFSWALIWVVHKKPGILWRLTVVIMPIVAIIVFYYLNIQEKWGLPIFRRSYFLKQIIRYDVNPMEFGKYFVVMLRQFLAKWYYLLAILGGYGIYRLKKEIYSKFFLIVFFLFLFICIKTGYYFIDRYIVAPVVALYPLAAYSFAELLGSKRKFLQAASMMTLLFCIGLWGGKVFTPPDPDKLARKEAGKWIVSQVGTEKELVTNRERIGFYAETTPFVFSSFDDLENEAKKIAMNKPYRERIALADMRKNDQLTMVVAIDTEIQEGILMEKKLSSWGLSPDNTFRNILVYLPKS